MAQGDDPDGDLATLDVLAALQKFPTLRPPPKRFVEALEPLQPRLYSISSSPKVMPGRLHLTVDTVRYRIDGRERLGCIHLPRRSYPAGRAAVGLCPALAWF
jgi:sulfite reductase (NADPH) flavoprotein alpha-component